MCISWRSSVSQEHKKSSHALNFLLADIYYHTIAIFLSGIFDSRTYWARSESHIQVPTLDQTKMQQHISAILHTTQHALERTDLSGVILLFPLRIAGFRIRLDEHKVQISELLRKISDKNFVIASTLMKNLSLFWNSS